LCHAVHARVAGHATRLRSGRIGGVGCGDPGCQIIAMTGKYALERSARRPAAAWLPRASASAAAGQAPFGLTGTAAAVLTGAGEEAQALGHHFIAPDHLMLGLLAQPDELAAQALAATGVTAQGIRERVRERLGTGAPRTTGSLGVSPQAKRLLELARAIAQSLGSRWPQDRAHPARRNLPEAAQPCRERAGRVRRHSPQGSRPAHPDAATRGAGARRAAAKPVDARTRANGQHLAEPAATARRLRSSTRLWRIGVGPRPQA
jgi:hypothetical protein